MILGLALGIFLAMDFYRLQPDFILDAVEGLGLVCSGHIQQLNSLENRVYDLGLDDGSHVVAKFYRPGRWSAPAIAEEHAFLARLHDAEVPVCAPLRLQVDGSEPASLHATGDHSLFYAVWPRTGGRLVDEFTIDLIERLGGYVARIHSVGAGLDFEHRPRFDAGHMVLRHRDYLVGEGGLPSKHHSRFEEFTALLESSLTALLALVPVQPIHGDCHTGNILLGDAGPFFLDFDDCVIGPVLQDLWMMVSDSPDRQQRKIDAFLTGYERFLAFPSESLKYLELMRALRYVAYTGWIARRRDDPAIQQAFPDFGADDFWEGFMRDLGDQLDHLAGEGALGESGNADDATPPSGAEGDDWTDSDYFFDMDDEDGRWRPGE